MLYCTRSSHIRLKRPLAKAIPQLALVPCLIKRPHSKWKSHAVFGYVERLSNLSILFCNEEKPQRANTIDLIMFCDDSGAMVIDQ